MKCRATSTADVGSGSAPAWLWPCVVSTASDAGIVQSSAVAPLLHQLGQWAAPPWPWPIRFDGSTIASNPQHSQHSQPAGQAESDPIT
ncbi:hypothetical protein E4U54_006861 [Claviceps lovelessii]|nr:hypothetical protein E4U54_006861 [Claviceps lovelessii]